MPRTAMAAVLTLVLSLAAVAPAAAAPPPNNPDDGIEVGVGVSFDQDTGPNVTFGQEANITNSNPWGTSNRITLDPWGYFESNGDTEVRVDRWNGTWTNLSQLDVSGADLTVDINDKPAVTVGGDAARLAYRENMGLDDGTVDFEYGGPDGGTTTLTLRGLPANTEIAAVAQDGTLLDAAESDGSGTVTFDELPQSDHTVSLQSYSSAAPQASNLSPDGSSTEDDPQNIQLSAGVSDADFPNDEVTVEFLVDGSVVGTQTITSNQTVTTNVSEQTAGTYDWSVEMTDDFGNTGTASSQFVVANKLRIYNESAPTNLVDNATVDLRFYGGQDGSVSETRTASNGVVNMSGLPATVPFVVVAESGDFRSRRIFVESLTETQSIYLLPDSVQYVEQTFELRDYSGDFDPSETVLLVQQNLNNSWRTVEGDYFGPGEEVQTQLAYNTRHQLIVLNTESGERENLGPFTPLEYRSRTVSVYPDGDIEVSTVAPRVGINPTTRTLPAQDDVGLTVRVNRSGEDLQSWTGSVRVNGSEVANTSRSADGVWSPALNLTGEDSNNLTVDITWETTGGATGSDSATYTIRETFTNGNSLLAILTTTLPGMLPNSDWEAFSTMIALLTTVIGTGMIGATLRIGTETLGIAALGFLTLFGILGWLSYSVVFASGVAWATVFGLRRVA